MWKSYYDNNEFDVKKKKYFTERIRKFKASDMYSRTSNHLEFFDTYFISQYLWRSMYTEIFHARFLVHISATGSYRWLIKEKISESKSWFTVIHHDEWISV